MKKLEDEITRIARKKPIQAVTVVLALGFVICAFVTPYHVNVCPTVAPHKEIEFGFSSNGACKAMYGCEYGYGDSDNLHCYCNDSWKVFFPNGDFFQMLKEVKR